MPRKASKPRKPRTDGRYQVSWTDPTGHRHFFYGRTVTEARENRAEYQARYRAGTVTRSTRQDFGQYLDYWLEDVAKPGIRFTAYKQYKSLIKCHIRPALGALKLPEIRLGHIEGLYRQLEKQGYSPATVQAVHRVISMVLRRAGPDGDEYILRSPAKRARLSKPAEQENVALTPEEQQRFLAACAGSWLGDLFTVQLYTGWRMGELRALKRPAINWGARVMTCGGTLTPLEGGGWGITAPKTALSARVTPLVQPALEALERQLDRLQSLREAAGEAWQEHGLVFPNRSGRPLSYQQITPAFAALLKEAGISERKPQSLRHTCETNLAAGGVDLRVRMALLGHKTERMALYYTSPLWDMQVAAMERMANRKDA